MKGRNGVGGLEISVFYIGEIDEQIEAVVHEVACVCQTYEREVSAEWVAGGSDGSWRREPRADIFIVGIIWSQRVEWLDGRTIQRIHFHVDECV